MLPAWSKLADYLGDLARSGDDLASLSTRFKHMIEPIGIETFACGKLNIENRSINAFYVIEWPEDWRDYYIRSGLINRDPIIDGLEGMRMAFTWSELRQDRRLSRAGSEAVRAAAEQGWTEGLIVPVELSHPFIGLVSLVARRSPFTGEEKAFLTLLSSHFYQRVRDAASATGFAMPPAGLTSREIDCLQLVAAGLPDRRIGESLGISAATAHEHVEKAKRKLNAPTRAGMVAVAVSLGIIRPLPPAES